MGKMSILALDIVDLLGGKAGSPTIAEFHVVGSGHVGAVIFQGRKTYTDANLVWLYHTNDVAFF